EATGIDQRPIHEVALRVVRIFIGIEYVVHREFADGEDEPVRRHCTAKLICRRIHLLAVAAEIDGLSAESARNAGIGYRLAFFERCAARKPGNAGCRIEAKTLIDFRIDPQFSALPQPHAEKRGGVPGFAPLVGDEAVWPDIGRAERRRILLKKGRLAVDGEVAEVERVRPLGKNLRIDAVAAELVIQSDPQRMHREIGGETLRAGGKVHAARTIMGNKISEPRRPAWGQHDFNAGTGRAADAGHHEEILDCAYRRRAADRDAGGLRPRKLIEAVGETARGIKQPMPRRVTDAAAYGASHFHLLPLDRLPSHPGTAAIA